MKKEDSLFPGWMMDEGRQDERGRMTRIQPVSPGDQETRDQSCILSNLGQYFTGSREPGWDGRAEKGGRVGGAEGAKGAGEAGGEERAGGAGGDGLAEGAGEAGWDGRAGGAEEDIRS